MGSNALLILRMLLDHPGGLYGSQISHLTGITHNSIYSLVHRLVVDKLIRTEEEPPTPAYNSARARYTITAQGALAYNKFLLSQGLKIDPLAFKG